MFTQLFKIILSHLKLEKDMLYISQEERSVLLKALEDFNSVDTDELLDVLDAHECK